ncbi:hypothetical protein M885DRAFT_541624 [Pelagophyceae sp. CCMP2097]|nr:hypothetical protein M885DRAFT_541624 [Pelagophyceae sp. CCMP2097]
MELDPAKCCVGATVRVLRGNVARRAMVASVNEDGTLDVVFEALPGSAEEEEATVPVGSASPLRDFESASDEPDSFAWAETCKARGSLLFAAKDFVAASDHYKAALAVVKRMHPLSIGSLVLVSSSTLKVGTVSGRDADAKTVDVMYDDGCSDDDELPMRRVVGIVAQSEAGRRLQLTTYLNLARCAAHVGRHKDAVACATLAGGLATYEAPLSEHEVTAKVLRARAHLAMHHLKPAIRDSDAATVLDPKSKAVLLLARDCEKAKREALRLNKQLARDVTTWVASAQEKYAEKGGDEANCNQQ